MNSRLEKQLEFLVKIDEIKKIFRHTRLFDNSRYENDAEHSWHLAVMAVVLSEHANQKIDLTKVIKMVLIHDIVEIEAGDFILYTDQAQEKSKKEKEAAQKIFSLLPDDQQQVFISLWQEFEAQETPEAKFAASLDRLEPLIQNYLTDGHAWKKHDINKKQVYEANQHINNGAKSLWDYAQKIIEEADKKGYFNTNFFENESSHDDFDRLYQKAYSVVNPQKLTEFAESGTVGAAILTEQQNIYTGVCIDTSSSMGFCAEHAAAAAMINAGESRIMKMIAVNEEGKIIPPCGRCREFIGQLNDKNMKTKVKISENKIVLLKKLLPCDWKNN